MGKNMFRVWGGEGGRGTQSHGDVLVNKLNDGTDIGEIWDEINEAMGVYNAQRSALAGLLSYRTTRAGENVAQGVQAEFFEEATEFGVPSGISDPSYVTLGYSWKDWDLGMRMSWKYLRAADAEQVQNRIGRALTADNLLVNGSILQRLLDPTIRINDQGHNVYGLYSGDMKPPDYMGQSFTSDHTHYLSTASTTLDCNHVEQAIEHIRHHGYGATLPATFVLLMNPADVKASKITSWRAGVEYRTSGPKPAYDFIVSSNAPAFITNEHVEGEKPPPEYNGEKVTGSYAGALLLESYFIPQGYVVVAASGGNGAGSNPVGFREDKNTAYQGLRIIPGNRQGYPIIESYLLRGFGTGVRHRGAAVAIQITSGSTYTPPVIVFSRGGL